MDMIEAMDMMEFRKTGALWWINQQLHLFGMAIVIGETTDDNGEKHYEMYPAKVKFRGFDEKSNTNGYRKLTNYLNDNANELLKDCDDKES